MAKDYDLARDMAEEQKLVEAEKRAARAMTRERAYDVRDSMKVRGFNVTVDEVLQFAREGYLPESVIGLDYDEARDETLLGLLTEEEVQFS